MAAVDLELDRSPTPSTSLLPVVGPHRKLNGRCRRSASDDGVAETSFTAEGINGDVPGAACAAAGASECFPGTSRDSVDMTQHPAGASAAGSERDQFYVDTKGAAADRATSLRRNVPQGTCAEAGSRTQMSLVATESRSAYARVADSCSLPPQVEQLRRDYVTSGPFSSDERRVADKFV